MACMCQSPGLIRILCPTFTLMDFAENFADTEGISGKIISALDLISYEFVIAL